eukprot:scaffold1509_cov240-Pinguiococcus_pyrenoidosus.AAC.34
MEPLVVVPGQIDVTVLPGRLVVCHAPTSNIPGAGWMVARTLLFNEERSCFNAVILDDEGCTMVMDEERAADAKRAGLGPFLSVADDRFWTAIHVQLGQSANDVPGLISHMAKALMRASISILHYSTYGTEIFLVQEKDYEEVRRGCAPTRFKRRGGSCGDGLTNHWPSPTPPPCRCPS